MEFSFFQRILALTRFIFPELVRVSRDGDLFICLRVWGYFSSGVFRMAKVIFSRLTTSKSFQLFLSIVDESKSMSSSLLNS